MKRIALVAAAVVLAACTPKEEAPAVDTAAPAAPTLAPAPVDSVAAPAPVDSAVQHDGAATDTAHKM